MNKKRITRSIAACVMLLVMVLGLAFEIAPTPVQAESLKDKLASLKEQKKELDKEIKGLESQLKSNLSDMKEIVEQKNLIDQEIALLHQQYTNTNQNARLAWSLDEIDKD